jgi:hypothetical protein
MQVNFSTVVPHSAASMYHDTPKARSYASWLSIGYELECIKQLAARIVELLTAEGPRDAWVLESLTWHAVLRYGRCFDSGASGRTAALGANHVRQLNVPDFASLHEGLIRRRHNTFAHPGGDCACRINVHLIESPEGARLHVVNDEEAPGPIVDPGQADLLRALCVALQGIVEEKVLRARNVLDAELDGQRTAIVQALRAKAGKHANPIQQALSILARVPSLLDPQA